MKNNILYKMEGPAEGIKRLAQSLRGRGYEIRERQELSGGWQVLTFAVAQDAPLSTALGEKLQQRFLPEGACYYRAESIEQHRVWTNDYYKKYFTEDYLLCVAHDAGRKSKELDVLRKELMKDAYAIPRADGGTAYRSYWSADAVRWLLTYAQRGHLPLRLSRHAAVDERRLLWQKAWD